MLTWLSVLSLGVSGSMWARSDQVRNGIPNPDFYLMTGFFHAPRIHHA